MRAKKDTPPTVNDGDQHKDYNTRLALLLAKLKRKPYEVTRIKHDVKDRIKRLSVYYMCIDDLPL